MTVKELDNELDKNQHIEYIIDDDEQCFLFRNPRLAWYSKNPNNATKITFDKMRELSVADLIEEINRGFEVEGITRVTGYMSKISGWNPGKLGELADRHKDEVVRGNY
jgi:hypothetical protein